MREQMGLGGALRDRFHWPNTQGPSSDERTSFEAECRKWEQWEARHRRSTGTPTQRRLRANSHLTLRPLSGHDLPGLRPNDMKQDDPTMLRRSLSVNAGQSSGYEAKGYPKASSDRHDDSHSIRPKPPLPTERLSRAMRVFVAWKAPDDEQSLG